VYIDRLKIDNVRGFGEAQIDLSFDHGDGNYAGWSVIAGRNGAGKTTLLRALALAVVGPHAGQLFGSTVGWVHDSAKRGNVTLRLATDLSDEFDPDFDHSEVVPVSLDWISNGRRRLATWEFDGNGPQFGGPWSVFNRFSRGWFLAGYGPFRRLTGQSEDSQRWMRGTLEGPRLRTLFREDASLLEGLDWLRDLRLMQADLKPGATRLLAAAFSLMSDGLLPEPEEKVVRYDSDGLWVESGRSGTRLVDDLSDGYRTVIAFVLDLVRSLHKCYGELPMIGTAVDLPGVVLIDEVDAHLHVSWQQRIGFWLKAHFPRIQFIVTSHSPFVCQAADKNGLILLPTPGTDEKARIADDELYYRAVNGPADAALLSDLFGMDHTWSDESEAKRIKMAKLESRILHGRASDAEKADYDKLREQVPTDEFETVQVDRARHADKAEPSKGE
jgi:energy-coupling factor transporter ATP-binding protein EcfA2